MRPSDARAGREILTTLAKQVGAQHRDDDLAPLINALPQLMTADPTVTQEIVQAAVTSAGGRAGSLRTRLEMAIGGKGDAILHRMAEDAIGVATDERQNNQGPSRRSARSPLLRSHWFPTY